MIGVEVRSDFKRVIAEFDARHAGVIDKATIRALNRALDKAQTEANSRIRDRYNVKAGVVRKAMKKIRAHRAQAYAFARLSIEGARIPLIEFGATWTRGQKVGASVKVLKAGGRKRIPGAFIGVHGYTGARQVFVRRGRERYPIKSLRSVSVPQQFANKVVREAVDVAVRESFDKNFRQQLKFLSGV
jgi:hypothetical protein